MITSWQNQNKMGEKRTTGRQNTDRLAAQSKGLSPEPNLSETGQGILHKGFASTWTFLHTYTHIFQDTHSTQSYQHSHSSTQSCHTNVSPQKDPSSTFYTIPCLFMYEFIKECQWNQTAFYHNPTIISSAHHRHNEGEHVYLLFTIDATTNSTTSRPRDRSERGQHPVDTAVAWWRPLFPQHHSLIQMICNWQQQEWALY